MAEETDTRDTEWFAARMPSKEVLHDLLEGDPVDTLLRVATDRAIANGGFDVVPRNDEAAARAAVTLATAAAQRLANEGNAANLTPEERAALDLFIVLVSRPALFVHKGNVLERPPNWPEIRQDVDLFPPVLAGVGRLDTASGGKRGTGFLAGERRILTNNHVLCALFGIPLDSWQRAPQEFAARCATESELWHGTPDAAPWFELIGEAGSTASERVKVARILGHHGAVDLAVLELASAPSGRKKLRLAAEAPSPLVGRRVYAVGYPVDDARDLWGNRVTPLPVFQRVFGIDDTTLGTKRFSPGVIQGWRDGATFLHDASTLPGSSGSCIVDFETRRVVGLHFGGRYAEKQNYAVALWKLRDDPVLVGNGIAFD